jgi:hypothetical protein
MKDKDNSVAFLCVFTFLVPCCDVRYDFRLKTIFGSFLPPDVCRRVDVLFTLFVFALECLRGGESLSLLLTATLSSEI